jgi:hypothetical protein
LQSAAADSNGNPKKEKRIKYHVSNPYVGEIVGKVAIEAQIQAISEWLRFLRRTVAFLKILSRSMWTVRMYRRERILADIVCAQS